MHHCGSHSKNFCEIFYLALLWKTVEKIQFCLNRTNIWGTLHEDLSKFYCCRQQKDAIKIYSNVSCNNAVGTHFCLVTMVKQTRQNLHLLQCLYLRQKTRSKISSCYIQDYLKHVLISMVLNQFFNATEYPMARCHLAGTTRHPTEPCNQHNALHLPSPPWERSKCLPANINFPGPLWQTRALQRSFGVVCLLQGLWTLG